MPALTSQFLFDLESRWRVIQANDYAALSATENMWWADLTKVIPSGARSEWISWVIETAMIEGKGKFGGNFDFPDIAMIETQIESEFAGTGLRLHRSQFEDSDGNGVNLGNSWMKQIAGQRAYWPQKQVTTLLKNGHLTTGPLAYDKKAFFATDHPLNPKNVGAGTYGNLIASVPIDVSVSADVALGNLQSVFSTIGAIKMPNGQDPRFLEPAGIMCSPKLYPRLVQLTDAKFIAATAGASGSLVGGSSDVSGLIASMGYGKPTKVPELAGFESDTTFFVIAKAQGVPDDDLAGFVYLERQPFDVRFYTGAGGGNGVDAILARSNTLEWQVEGRNATAYGHPYRIFKCKAGA